MMATLEMELGAEWAWLWRWVWPRCTTSCWEMITVSLATTSWLLHLLSRETRSRADLSSLQSSLLPPASTLVVEVLVLSSPPCSVPCSPPSPSSSLAQ